MRTDQNPYRPRLHSRAVVRAPVALLALCFLDSAQAQQCIAAPVQTAPYIRAAINASLTSIVGLGSSRDVGIAIEGGIRDVYRQYPNADKLVVMQALLAQSCEVIKGLSLSATEKLSAYNVTQSRVLRLFSDSDISLRPENLKFLYSEQCYGLPVRATWQTRTDLDERSVVYPPAGSPEAAVGMTLAVRTYPASKTSVSMILKEPLSGPSNVPSTPQLSRYLREMFELWETDNCCKVSKWINSSEATVVATDKLTALNPPYEPRKGIAMTYQRDSKVIQALAYFAPSTAFDSNRLGGVWVECRVDENAATAYETYCKTILSQFRFTLSPPHCGVDFERRWQRGEFMDTIPMPPKN